MAWYDYIIDNKETLVNSLKFLANPIGAATSAATNQLMNTARNWYADFKTLEQIPDSELSPELLAEKRRLLNQGYTVINKIKSIGIGADFLNQQMGAIPVIATAVIAATAGLMYYWTLDYQKFKMRTAEYKSLRAQGLTDEQAKATIKTIDAQSSLFGDLSGTLKYAAIGGGLFLVFFMMDKKALKKRLK